MPDTFQHNHTPVATPNPVGYGALWEIIQEVYDNSEIKSVMIIGAGKDTFATGTAPKKIQTLNKLNGRKFTEHSQEPLRCITL